MPDVFELGYVYARVSGAISKSFLGAKALPLTKPSRAADLWRIVFRDTPPALPETILIAQAERRRTAQALAQFRKLVDDLEAPEPFFIALRRKAEFGYVKRILLHAKRHAPRGELPPNDDPSLEASYDIDKYPDLDSMFSKGRYSWIDESALADLPETENRLDRQFYTELWKEAQAISPSKAAAIPRLIREEAELQNLVWALRLKRYYRMEASEIEARLIDLKGIDIKRDALTAITLRQDHREDWKAWAYESLLGGEAGRLDSWLFDVRDFERAAHRRLYSSVRRALRLEPFSYTPLYCFFKLKEYETAAVLGAFEAARLGAPPEETAAFLLGITGGTL